jgi:hypothetical protein
MKTSSSREGFNHQLELGAYHVEFKMHGAAGPGPLVLHTFYLLLPPLASMPPDSMSSNSRYSSSSSSQDGWMDMPMARPRPRSSPNTVARSSAYQRPPEYVVARENTTLAMDQSQYYPFAPFSYSQYPSPFGQIPTCTPSDPSQLRQWAPSCNRIMESFPPPLLQVLAAPQSPPSQPLIHNVQHSFRRTGTIRS